MGVEEVTRLQGGKLLLRKLKLLLKRLAYSIAQPRKYGYTTNDEN